MNTTRLLGVLFLPLVACAVSEGADAPSTSEDALRAGPVPVTFNHAYGIVSEATDKAVRTNRYLKERFADVEVRTTVRPDVTYTGTYLNLRETYLELFPEGTFDFPRDVFGIALGDEERGGYQAVRKVWAKEFGAANVSTDLVQREVDGVQVPWFHSVDLAWTNESAAAVFWNMEYTPNPGSTKPRTRREERAARYDATKLARDVTEIAFAAPDFDRTMLERSFRSVGWAVRRVGGGFVAASPVDGGVSRRVWIVPSTARRVGLLGAKIRLNRYEAHTEQLGDARLDVGVFGRPLAFLWFGPPAADVTFDASEGSEP